MSKTQGSDETLVSQKSMDESEMDDSISGLIEAEEVLGDEKSVDSTYSKLKRLAEQAVRPVQTIIQNYKSYNENQTSFDTVTIKGAEQVTDDYVELQFEEDSEIKTAKFYTSDWNKEHTIARLFCSVQADNFTDLWGNELYAHPTMKKPLEDRLIVADDRTRGKPLNWIGMKMFKHDLISVPKEDHPKYESDDMSVLATLKGHAVLGVIAFLLNVVVYIPLLSADVSEPILTSVSLLSNIALIPFLLIAVSLLGFQIGNLLAVIDKFDNMMFGFE